MNIHSSFLPFNGSVNMIFCRRLAECGRYEVRFNVDVLEGNSFAGSLIFNEKPRLSRIMDFALREMGEL